MSAEALDLKMPVVVMRMREIFMRRTMVTQGWTAAGIGYRDPADVRTIHRQSRLLILSLAMSPLLFPGGL
jgi:hypothetical protein